MEKCTCGIVIYPVLGREHSSQNMQGREKSTYLEKRFKMRPAGVVSKKVIGDLKIA